MYPQIETFYNRVLIHLLSLNCHNYTYGDTSGRAVLGVVLWLLACWDFEFESRRSHGSLYLLLLYVAK
jgi:hypothetical protein